ncbi:MAG TPA: hypothetical protein VL284_03640 [Thermoanaerobaculia bacterium]|nr:hypothetical protein [Thermoanaerobaculia bacterium]
MGALDASRRERLAAALLLVLLALTLHAAFVIFLLPRQIDHDEGEYLRGGEWIASGQVIYRDFFENHMPYLPLILSRMAPTTLDFDALRQYIYHARILTAIAGTAAALCAGVFAARVAGNALAAVPAVAVLFLPGPTFMCAIANVRPEAFTLILFWGGALLIIGRESTLLGGLGAGLAAAGALWNPKYPLETAILLIYYATSLKGSATRSLIASLMIAFAIPTLVLAVALRVASPGALFFFDSRYSAAFYAWFRSAHLVGNTFEFNGPFDYCSAWFFPVPAIIAFVTYTAAVVYAWRKSDGRQRRLAVLLAAFVIAGALEIRFLYSYPRLWPQYFTMWGCSLAALYGTTAALALRRYRIALFALAALAVVAYSAEIVRILRMRIDQSHWVLKAAVLSHLRPGEAAWLQPFDAPFAAPAGSYYWYGFYEQVPFTLAYARTPEGRQWLPQLAESDLPPCRMLDAHLHGLAPAQIYVHFIDELGAKNLPIAKRCTAELIERRFARRIGDSTILEVAMPPRRAAIPPTSTSVR